MKNITIESIEKEFDERFILPDPIEMELHGQIVRLSPKIARRIKSFYRSQIKAIVEGIPSEKLRSPKALRRAIKYLSGKEQDGKDVQGYNAKAQEVSNYKQQVLERI